MEYRDVNGLELKRGIQSGPNAFIRKALTAIPQGQAMRLVDIKDEVLKEFPSLIKGLAIEDGDKARKVASQRVYIRLAGLYKKVEGLKKYVDGNGYTCIGK